MSNSDRRKDVLAIVACRGLKGQTHVGVEERHAGIRNNRPARIRNDSGNCPFVDLSEAALTLKQQEAQASKCYAAERPQPVESIPMKGHPKKTSAFLRLFVAQWSNKSYILNTK
jgi:hypothetical protein